MSTDGGTSWAAVWDANGTAQSGHVVVALGAAAKTANVGVRFHYTGSFAYYWEVDNVLVGDSKPVPTHGGLLEGVVKDANTAGDVKGAKVTNDTDAPSPQPPVRRAIRRSATASTGCSRRSPPPSRSAPPRVATAPVRRRRT